MTSVLPEAFRFSASEFKSLWLNSTTLRRRAFDVHFVSMHNAGTHWLKYSLGVAISHVYGIAPPAHIQDDRIIGHTKSLPQPVDGLPVIVHSHSLPNSLLRYDWVMGSFHFPSYVVLVRDIADSLHSAYVKWREDYPVSFQEFVHASAFGKSPVGGLWHEIHFWNGWGDIARRHPGRVHVVRYEDMQKDMRSELRRVWQFMGLAELSEEALDAAMDANSKAEMAKRPNPEVARTVVRSDDEKSSSKLSAQDLEFVRQTQNTYLRHHFGYAIGQD